VCQIRRWLGSRLLWGSSGARSNYAGVRIVLRNRQRLALERRGAHSAAERKPRWPIRPRSRKRYPSSARKAGGRPRASDGEEGWGKAHAAAVIHDRAPRPKFAARFARIAPTFQVLLSNRRRPCAATGRLAGPQGTWQRLGADAAAYCATDEGAAVRYAAGSTAQPSRSPDGRALGSANARAGGAVRRSGAGCGRARTRFGEAGGPFESWPGVLPLVREAPKPMSPWRRSRPWARSRTRAAWTR